MNRRNFLKKAVTGAAIAAAATVVPLSVLAPTPAPVVVNAVIGEYAEYCSFSDMAIAKALDEVVENAAMELGTRAGQSISFLYNTAAS